MNLQKISQYFFIIAAIITIFDGVFELTPEMANVKFIVLILSGLVVGVMRRNQDDQFLISGIVFTIAGYVLIRLLQPHMMLSGIEAMIIDFLIFIASAVFILSLERVVLEVASPGQNGLSGQENDFNELKHKAERDIETQTFEHIWGVIILFAVALTFISLLTQLFFEAGPFLTVFNYVDALITIIFIADLLVLYLQSKNLKDFAKRHVVDIIAAIPAIGVLRVLKLVRALRIIKMVGKGAKMGQAVKLYKTAKFFSDHSYFNMVEEAGSEKTTSTRRSGKKTSKKRSSRQKK